jgi:hypothetical protein
MSFWDFADDFSALAGGLGGFFMTVGIFHCCDARRSMTPFRCMICLARLCALLREQGARDLSLRAKHLLRRRVDDGGIWPGPVQGSLSGFVERRCWRVRAEPARGVPWRG